MSRLCQLVDPSHKDYKPSYIQTLDPEWAPRRPGPISIVANFASALLRHAADSFRQAPADVVAARLAKCRDCSSLRDGTCMECGCPVARKAEWASEACPRGFWPAIEPEAKPGCKKC